MISKLITHLLGGPRDWSVIQDDDGDIYALPTGRVSPFAGDVVMHKECRKKQAFRIARQIRDLRSKNEGRS